MWTNPRSDDELYWTRVPAKNLAMIMKVGPQTTADEAKITIPIDEYGPSTKAEQPVSKTWTIIQRLLVLFKFLFFAACLIVFADQVRPNTIQP